MPCKTYDLSDMALALVGAVLSLSFLFKTYDSQLQKLELNKGPKVGRAAG